MLAAIDGELAGIVAVADTVKADSQQAIAALKSHGVNVVMLTGDNETTAHAVANQVGVSNVIAGVRPENKADEIAKLQAQGYTVAMVGDGINDAPALARANVGFAIGTGTDVAIQSADVTLMNGSLMGLVHALDLTRATMRNIAQNLGFALGYNSVGISIAAGVLYPFTGMMLNPMIAGAAMAFSSLCVVTNASRLRLFDPDKALRKTYQVRQPNPNDNNHNNHSQKGFIMGLFSDHKAKKENAHESMEGMHSCCGGHAANDNQSALAKDPVCGMSVDPATAAATREYNGTAYYFCNPGCAARVRAEPHPIPRLSLFWWPHVSLFLAALFGVLCGQESKVVRSFGLNPPEYAAKRTDCSSDWAILDCGRLLSVPILPVTGSFGLWEAWQREDSSSDWGILVSVRQFILRYGHERECFGVRGGKYR